MKKMVAIITMVTLLFTMAVVMPVMAGVPTNSAVNGGFETVTEGILEKWSFENTTQEAALVTNADEAYEGNSYLKFEAVASASATYNVTAGKTYVVSVRYKATANNAATFQVYDAIGRAYAYQNTLAKAQTDWAVANVMITVNKTLQGTVRVALGSASADATVCFDAVTVLDTEHDYANMVLNGDFELDTATGQEWEHISNWYSGNGTKLEASTSHGGNNSIATRNQNESFGVILINNDNGTTTAAGEKYKFSFWINDSALTEGKMPWLRFWPMKMHADATTSSRGDVIPFSPEIETADTWTKCEYEVTLPEDVNYLKIQIFSGTGWTRFDDFVFTKLSSTPTPDPGDDSDYDLQPEEGNLLLNGSFEVGTVDSNKIPGWEQTGAENMYTINAHPSYIDNTDGGKQSIYVDLAGGLGDAGLKQTATIDTEADWYVNYEDYSYELSYAAYAAGSIYRGYVNVIMTDANGKSYTRSYNPTPTTTWAVNKVCIDLTSQTLDVGGPVASIEVQLIASSTMFEMRWDGVKLAPVPAPEVYNLIKNESFEKDDTNATEITYWTQAREDHSFAVEEHAVYSAKAGDGGKKTAAITFPDTAENGAEAAIKQTVVIDTNAPWYTDYENYMYELSYKGYAAGSVFRGYVNVTVNGTGGKSSTVKYSPTVTTVWAMNDVVLDLSSQVRGIGGTVTSFDIELVAQYSPYGNGMKYDGVRLVPVYKKTLEDISVNGSFEELTEEETLDTWRIVNTTVEESLINNAVEAHTGDNYLKFEGVSNMLATATYEVEYGKTYMLEVFYKSTTANAARIQLMDATGRSYLYQDTRPEAPSVWTPARAMITIGKSLPAPTIRIYLANMIEDATVCFDTVKLYCMGDFDGNMVLNGDFEADNARNSEWENITNWSGGNAIKLENNTAHSGENSYAIRQQNNAYVSQIMINLDDRGVTAEGDKYKFSFWINDSAVTEGKLPWVRLFPYKMNLDTTLTAKGDPIALNPVIETKDTWTYCEFIIELPADVNCVTIQLFAGEDWTRFDDFELREAKNRVYITDAEGNVLTELPETVDGTYTAHATYIGDEQKARVYIAEYKIVDGAEELVKINYAAFTEESVDAECAVEVEGAESDNTVIRAFVWEGSMLPVTMISVE